LNLFSLSFKSCDDFIEQTKLFAFYLISIFSLISIVGVLPLIWFINGLFVLRKEHTTEALCKAKQRTKQLVFVVFSCIALFFTVILVDAYNETENYNSLKLEEELASQKLERLNLPFDEIVILRSAISFSKSFLADAKLYPSLLESTCNYIYPHPVSEEDKSSFNSLFEDCYTPQQLKNSQLPQLQEMLRVKATMPDYDKSLKLEETIENINRKLRYTPKSYYPREDEVFVSLVFATLPLIFLFIYTKLGTNILLKNSSIFTQLVAQTDMGVKKGSSVNIVNTDKLKHYSVAEELLKWKELKESGVISEEEFLEAKRKILEI